MLQKLVPHDYRLQDRITVSSVVASDLTSVCDAQMFNELVVG